MDRAYLLQSQSFSFQFPCTPWRISNHCLHVHTLLSLITCLGCETSFKLWVKKPHKALSREAVARTGQRTWAHNDPKSQVSLVLSPVMRNTMSLAASVCNFMSAACWIENTNGRYRRSDFLSWLSQHWPFCLWWPTLQGQWSSSI